MLTRARAGEAPAGLHGVATARGIFGCNDAEHSQQPLLIDALLRATWGQGCRLQEGCRPVEPGFLSKCGRQVRHGFIGSHFSSAKTARSRHSGRPLLPRSSGARLSSRCRAGRLWGLGGPRPEVLARRRDDRRNEAPSAHARWPQLLARRSAPAMRRPH